jgi:hypothetical protein
MLKVGGGVNCPTNVLGFAACRSWALFSYRFIYHVGIAATRIRLLPDAPLLWPELPLIRGKTNAHRVSHPCGKLELPILIYEYP